MVLTFWQKHDFRQMNEVLNNIEIGSNSVKNRAPIEYY